MPQLHVIIDREKSSAKSHEQFPLMFLPLSANKVKALDYKIDGNCMQPEDFDSLNIATSDLRLEIDVDDSDEWSGLLVAFLNRVAELGHFERLSFSFRAPFHGT